MRHEAIVEGVVLVGALAGALAVNALAQNLSSYKAQGAIPEVVNIKASMPDVARICVERPDGGLVACRSIGDLRKWVLDKGK